MTKSAIAALKNGKAPMSQEKKDALLFWSLGIFLAVAAMAGWSYVEFGNFWGMLGFVPLGIGAPMVYESSKS